MVDAQQRLRELGAYWATTRDVYGSAVSAEPARNSDIAGDFALVGDGLGTYAQAVALIENAVDAADALSTLWTNQLYHVPADYMLIRGIVDYSMKAIWLLDPDDPSERTTRAWRLLRDSPSRAKNRAEAMIRANPTRPSRPQLIREAQNAGEYIQELDIAFAAALGTPRRPVLVEASEYIEVAEAQPFHSGRDGDVTRFWGQLSELVHGASVPIQARLKDVGMEGVFRLTQPDLDALARVAGLATGVFERALQLFYQRVGWEVD
ncbi:hypothetical protein [Agromyces sp. NPDC058126]|uniref:hypothetical protein n=1 Tax=Agromyces sp. NPDC058126 TaxID=3346350 RepID=UPI0036D99134